MYRSRAARLFLATSLAAGTLAFQALPASAWGLPERQGYTRCGGGSDEQCGTTQSWFCFSSGIASVCEVRYVYWDALYCPTYDYCPV